MSIIFAPELEPLMPRQQAIDSSDLPKLSAELDRLSKVGGRGHNDYCEVDIANFSNLIEGIEVSAEEIVQAKAFVRANTDNQLRNVHSLLAAPILASRFISNQNDQDSFSSGDLQALHRVLVDNLPNERREGNVSSPALIGGEFRAEEVIVGNHLAPPPNRLASLLGRYSTFYNAVDLTGPHRFVAIAAAHHRLMWIHPFLDGNGRVARVFTEWLFHICANKHPSTQNLNCEIYSTVDDYRRYLSLADSPRQGSTDGRGALSERCLIAFCEYFLGVMLKALTC